MNTPAHPQAQRSLAAIVITDAVGFSKRMSQDEDTALIMINRDLKVIKQLCNSFEGKILKTTGDGVLMYFISAVKAVSCAMEIQRQFATFAKNGRADEHFTHRIGVHLGDIFFNQEDMMGTGVNIAARLESEAKPGAICMSQVVYEVVKYRLKLDAIYAGELSLKNIEQCVAAYHVWPPGVQPQKNAAQFSEAIFPLVTPLNTVLKALSAHLESHRIKKLLYAVHHDRWEDNAKILEGLSLKLLLESLTDRNADLAECQDTLNDTINSSGEAEDYSLIVKVIVESLKDFYGEDSHTETKAGSPSLLESNPSLVGIAFKRQQPDDMAALYKSVADKIETFEEHICIKQILYYVCCNQWESLTERIRAIPTVSLVQELRQKVTSFQMLKSQLHKVLLSSEREEIYTSAVDKILQEGHVLYHETKDETFISADIHSIRDDAEETNGKLIRQPNVPPNSAPIIPGLAINT
ncbi:adenylate/guanylate cyclase domain-containing protein [cf. Phormidesmis sp. LEGE 11477]|uniref:adenylate/guanylate cyclase domain-containing protein n=1 Tax=cf. Phormidesmis sp. LEGE 11477 TaxID=1828680 RepID=UPI00187FF126|nr:adenylate/guanylate cyclase domain-containing protein [cf. Phormidesmis sp. LEGE 11477]MBE9060967.1 adenylate/guanylate cyclase domain-containing protein [cf. Phormidesmis sp. LEGE 11477]